MEVHNGNCDFTLYFGISIDFQMIISVITVVGTLFGLVVPTGTYRSAALFFIATALTAILPPPPHNRTYFPPLRHSPEHLPNKSAERPVPLHPVFSSFKPRFKQDSVSQLCC